MQQHVVCEGAHCKPRLGIGVHDLEGFRDGCRLASRMVRVLPEEEASHLCGVAWAGQNGGAEGLHQVAPARLVVVRRAHHVDDDLDPHERSG